MKIKTSFLILPQDFATPTPADLLSIMAKYTFGWFQSQLDVLPVGTFEPPQDWSRYRDMADQVKAINPEWKCGLYIGGVAFQRQWEPGYPGILDSDLYHKPDGSLLIYDDGNPQPSRYRWFRTINEGVRARLIAWYLDWLADTHFDGVFLDSWNPSFYATMIRSAPPTGFFGLAGGILEGPAQLTDYWAQSDAAWIDELTLALEAEGHRTYVNGVGLTPGYSPTDPDWTYAGDGQLAAAQSGSGFMFEHGHRLYKDASRFAEILDLYEAARDLDGREAWLQCFPLLFGATDLPTPPTFTEGLDLQRFYLASYLLVQGEHTVFSYYQYHAFDPNGDTSSNAVLHWCADWDLDYGEPTGRASVPNVDAIRWREYTRGVAVVNPTANAKYFTRVGTYRVWDPEDGFLVHITNSAATQYLCPPYSGHFLFAAGGA